MLLNFCLLDFHHIFHWQNPHISLNLSIILLLLLRRLWRRMKNAVFISFQQEINIWIGCQWPDFFCSLSRHKLKFFSLEYQIYSNCKLKYENDNARILFILKNMSRSFFNQFEIMTDSMPNTYHIINVFMLFTITTQKVVASI